MFLSGLCAARKISLGSNEIFSGRFLLTFVFEWEETVRFIPWNTLAQWLKAHLYFAYKIATV